MSKGNNDFFKVKKDWSEIKDRLLAYYLPQYFQKVLMTNKPIFYVDCFAGMGKFDDGKDGSPRIALQIRDSSICHSRAQSPLINTCFIDLNYGNELKANTAEFNNQNGIPLVIQGRYEEEIEKLLSDKRGQNVFLYIDPYGIRALNYTLFSKFADYGFSSIEMLINMNSFGFMRAACRAMKVDYVINESLDDLVEYDPTQVDASVQSINLLNSIAGGDFWQTIVMDYTANKIDGYEAEKRFSNGYKQQLRKKYTYVLDMPICIKSRQHPKYRMIHISNHEDGCILMADNMFSRSEELFVEVQNQGQLSLFSFDVQNNTIDENDIRQKMLDFLATVPNGMTADKLIAAFFTEYGVVCKSGVLRDIWKEFEKNGTIEVIRIPATTPTGLPSAFFTEDRKKKQSVTIRRLRI
ncbi:three-Cys-motif partner protein TcmP [Allofournierella sp.]|uniref:three-Cys-motif partner protein TcmP n=1 Tax=Allofournierella sp. TaxID=1940256 RepID=UPI003AF1CA4B